VSRLNLLSRLRRYTDGDIGSYLKTEMRQNYKAIEGALGAPLNMAISDVVTYTNVGPLVAQTSLASVDFISTGRPLIMALTSSFPGSAAGTYVRTNDVFGSFYSMDDVLIASVPVGTTSGPTPSYYPLGVFSLFMPAVMAGPHTFDFAISNPNAGNSLYFGFFKFVVYEL